MGSLQVCRSSKKATAGVSTLRGVLFLAPFSATLSATSAMETLDPVSWSLMTLNQQQIYKGNTPMIVQLKIRSSNKKLL